MGFFGSNEEVDIIVTTTDYVEGKNIDEYLDIVTGEAIVGANFLRDFMAGITDVIGGRSASYEKSLRKAKNIAIKELKENAAELGANAVVGIDLDYETMGKEGGMMMVSASGTAVIISK